MDLFNRFWSLRVKDRLGAFDFTIKQDEDGNSLRGSFEINATIDIRYYTGTIQIYNLGPDKRENLVFNLLKEEFGTGPLVQLTAGYQEKSGLIFNGAITRSYNVRQPESGDWITKMQVGLPFAQSKQITIPSQKVNQGTLFNFLFAAIEKIINQPNRIEIAKADGYSTNFRASIDEYFASGNTINESLGFSGSSIQIIDEIQSRFNLYFFQDNNGFNVTSGKYSISSDPRSPVVLPAGNAVPEITFSKDTGLIGSPIYTDTGAKIISYLRPEARMFQLVRVDSDILKRNISILELIHRGDTHTDEWYSEIDGSNFNQLIRQ